MTTADPRGDAVTDPIAQAEVDALRAERDHYRVMIAKLAAEIDADDGRGDVTGEKGWRLLADAVMGRVFGLRAELSVARAEIARLTAASAPLAPKGKPRTCPTHGATVTCYCTTGTPHCGVDDCGYTPPFCEACVDHHDQPMCSSDLGDVNPHPDGCHTIDATAPRDCTGDGHHECSSCARLDRAERAANGDPAIGGEQ